MILHVIMEILTEQYVQGEPANIWPLTVYDLIVGYVTFILTHIIIAVSHMILTN